MYHALGIAVILAGVFVPSLELSGDDLHADELLPVFVRILRAVYIVRHTAAEGTCELIHKDSDHYPVWYFSVGVPSINLI